MPKLVETKQTFIDSSRKKENNEKIEKMILKINIPKENGKPILNYGLKYFIY